MITETNILRILESGYRYGYILISACRGSEDLMGKPKKELNKKELSRFEQINNERTNQLKKELKSEKLTFIEVDGGYIEETGEKVDENSFFVLNREISSGKSIDYDDFFYLGVDLCAEFNQDSFLYFDPKNKKYDKPTYFGKDGKQAMQGFDSYVINDLKQTYYTKYKDGQQFSFTMDEKKGEKNLIPFTVKNIDKNKWSITVDENEPFEIEATEDEMRTAILRTKAKDGNGIDRKRSSKKGTYRNMLDGETHYMWKSKSFKSAEDFSVLLEKSNHLKKTFDKAFRMNENKIVDYIYDELEEEFTDEEINDALDDYLKRCQVGGGMVQQFPTNVRGVGMINNMYS